MPRVVYTDPEKALRFAERQKKSLLPSHVLKGGRTLYWLYASSLSPRETFSSHLRSIYKSRDAT